MVASETQVMFRGFHRVGNAEELHSDLLFALSNQALILVCKFLEIWREFGSLRGKDSRVGGVQAAVMPYVRRINVWTGLEQFRNGALAHPYLTKDKKLIGPWELIAENRAPTYHAECILLLKCVKLAVLAILSAYPAQYIGIAPLLRTSKPEPGPSPGIASGQEIDPELKRLSRAVDAALAEIGISVSPLIATEFKIAETPRDSEDI